jgi:hypothetical protein
MALKLPADQATGNYADDEIAVEAWLHEKEAWRRDRVVQGNKVADVVRYTETGGDPATGTKPTQTLVSGLTNLQVHADTVRKRHERKFGVSKIEDADRVFVFYNVTGNILATDTIEFDDDRYEIMEIGYEEESGRYDVLAKMIRSDV